MNALKVSFQNMFQMAGGSGNTKISNAKDNAFDTVMKQNVKKSAYSESDVTVSSKNAIKSTTVSEQNLKVTKNTDKSVGEADASENTMETIVANDLDENLQDSVETIVQNETVENLQNSAEITTKDTKNGISLADDDKKSEDLEETITSFLEQLNGSIQDIIKKDMDLDEEDIQKVLEQMGITITQLLDTSKLQQFVLQNAGEEVSALLTNEALATQFNQVSADMDEMCMVLESNWDISKTNIGELFFISENEQMFQQQNITDMELPNVLEDFGSDIELDNEKVNALLEKVAAMTEDISRGNMAEQSNTGTVVKMKQTEGQVISDFEQVQDISLQQDSIVVEAEDSREDTEHFEQQQSSEQPQTKENVVTQFVQELVQARTEVEGNVSNQAEQLQQMREIVTQVVEQIKVVVKEDTSSMEMQLNPEKLGKVNLSVVSKNGQMTASFVTENEMAKKALESQMQSLKDTLQNQGLKVEAIEVSVSDFKFEQSSNMNEEQQRQSNDNKKKAPRKIDLSMLKEGFDDLSEEDTLVAQVMIGNGNMVDYTA